MASGASAKTASLELGTLRALLRFHDLAATWSAIGKKIKLTQSRRLGRCISLPEESALLKECRVSRSRSLPVAIMVALEACLRRSEIRLLQWRQLDFARRTLTVGESKTDAGQGRAIPLSRALFETLSAWSLNFPGRKLSDFVFPSEKYGEGGKVCDIDPTRPIQSWKEAWESATERAGVSCRFHDLRHTACTRLLEAGVSHTIVAELMGWSTSTAIRMLKIYGHIGMRARQNAIEQRERFMT
jgi:integrase